MKCKAMIWLLCIMVMFTACSLHDPHLPNNSEPSITTSPYSEELTEGLHIHDSDTIEDSIKIELGAQTEDSVYRAWHGELYEMLLPVGFNYDKEKLNSFDKNSEKTAYKLEYTSASFIDIDVDKRNAYYPSLFTNLTSEGIFWNLGNNSDTKNINEYATSTTLKKLEDALTNPQSIVHLYDETLIVVNHYVFVSYMTAKSSPDITIEMYLETNNGDYVYVYCQDLAENDYTGYECNDGFMFSLNEYTKFCKAVKISEIEEPTFGYSCFYRTKLTLLFEYVLHALPLE